MKKQNRKVGRAVVRGSETDLEIVIATGPVSEEKVEASWSDAARKAAEASKKAHSASSAANGSGNARLHMIARTAHRQALVAHTKAYDEADDMGQDHHAEKHTEIGEDHREAMRKHTEKIERIGDGATKASEIEEEKNTVQAKAVVQCKASGTPILAKKTWEVDKPIDFMWMPGGLHTIHASYGRTDADTRPIELTVNCNEAGGKAVQAAFETIKANNPRRPPFICVEHQAKERAGVPLGFEWRSDPEPAIYCRCHPSALGANNVNGKIHTSFSPTFDTDAEYHKMQCTECEKAPSVCACQSGDAGWFFPDGVRGSLSNPALVTAPDIQSVGSLTNWNAFRTMLPVAARENKVVEAAGTSEGVKKSWEERRQHANGLSDKARLADAAAAKHDGTPHEAGAHFGAAMAHQAARKAHEAARDGAPDKHTRTFHDDAVDYHDRHSERHGKASDAASKKNQKAEDRQDRNKASESEEEKNLAVHASGNTDQQPEPNAEQSKDQTMKVKFIRAVGSFAVGTEADLAVDHAAVLAGDALVPAAADAYLLRETELTTVRAREKEGKALLLVQACDRGVTRGALLAKGDTDLAREKVLAKYQGRLERGECSAEIAVEAIDALPVVQAVNTERQTTSSGTARADLGYGSGEVSGDELVKAAINACMPFVKSLPNGGLIAKARGQGAHAKLLEARELSMEKSRLFARLNNEMGKGFVVRAATLNYVDPASNNPLGLLNTELMVLQNLGHLENQLRMIRDITTDIAGQPVSFNQQVRSRYFAIPKVQLKTATTAWSGGTGSNVDVNVKLDQYAGVEIALENTMLASTPRNLFQEQRDPQLYGLGEYVIYKLISTLFGGNTRIANDDSTTATIKFQDNASNVFSITGATLKTFVSDLPAKLDSLKMPGGDEDPSASDLARFAWVHTRPYADATGDTNFILNQSIQSIRPGGSHNGNVMETGRFERLGNLKFRKSQLMADNISITGSGADGTTNGISVNAPDFAASAYIGFAGTRSSMLFVSRIPEDWTQVLPGVPQTAALEVVTSPTLGISFLMVKYLDNAYEIAKMRVQLMFGFGIGDERQGCILSA